MEHEGLTWSSDRSFRLWRYGIGHSQLSMRSFGSESADTLEIFFEGVERIELSRAYHGGIRVSIEEREAAEPGPVKHLMVSIDGSFATGVVVCSRVTVRRLDTDGPDNMDVLVSVHS